MLGQTLPVSPSLTPIPCGSTLQSMLGQTLHAQRLMQVVIRAPARVVNEQELEQTIKATRSRGLLAEMRYMLQPSISLAQMTSGPGPVTTWRPTGWLPKASCLFANAARLGGMTSVEERVAWG